MAAVRASDVADAQSTPKQEPPKRKTQARTAYRTPPTLGGNTKEFYKKNVSGLLQVAGAAAFPASPADACAIVAHSENISESVADLAEQDQRVARILDRILEIGPYGALLSAVMPLAVQILVNHNILKPGMLGSVPPEQIIEAVVVKQDATENKTNGHPSSAATGNVPA